MKKLDIENAELFNGHSQKGQHCYIKKIFDTIGTTNKYYVDVGAYDGRTNSNVYDLKVSDNWYGLMIDNNLENIKLNLHKHTVTQENICRILGQYNVPYEIDLLCIDIDGMDYWILSSILQKYSPRVIVIETNIRFGQTESKVMKYDSQYSWDGLNWYGCSPYAAKKLANANGYTPVYMHHDDMFIIRNDCLSQEDIDIAWERVYSGPNFELYKGHTKSHHPIPIKNPINEQWEEI